LDAILSLLGFIVSGHGVELDHACSSDCNENGESCETNGYESMLSEDDR
jgi:hypothetical protein